MIFRVGPLFLLLALLAGCGTPTPPPSVHLLPPEGGPESRDPVVEAPVELPPAVQVPGPVEIPGGWVMLETWGRTNGFDSLRRTGTDNALSFELRGERGAWKIWPGSQHASWRGMQVWLGFPPRLLQGKPWVHALDVQKTLQPLLRSKTPLPSQPVVVVDPGHGGPQVGTRSILSVRFEKEFTLDWALRLRPLLQAQGWKVVLTRTNDTDVSLLDRVAMSERSRADLFLSLHFNSSFPQMEHAGLETYCTTPRGMPSNLQRNYGDEPAQEYPNNRFDEQNIRWAARVHGALLEAGGANDRGIRRARFMAVIRGQSRPAVLVEAGYLSNPKEARLIATADYRQKLAQGIAAALVLPARPENGAP